MGKIIDIFANSIFIKPRLNLLEWSEQYRVLSRESSSNYGKFRAFSYQKEAMSEISNPQREKIILLWASQLGKSEMINNTIGFYIHQEPSTILFVLPNKDDAEDYSKRRLAPMIRDCEPLDELINADNANNTILIKNFRGGNLALVGSSSPTKLASKPIKILLVDEADRCQSNEEGDSIDLALKRTQTFADRKIIISSTPTIAGSSKIESEYELSDQREFYIRCPHCSHEQTLKFERVVWELDKNKNLIADKVGYQCSECGAILNEQDKNEAVKNGVWIAKNPNSEVAGFRLNSLYSPFFTLAKIVKEFINAKDNPLKLQVFKNTIEAKSYEPPTSSFNENEFLQRVETYTPQTLPQNVKFVTAGVDIQGNRIEVIFIGWGVGFESWSIDHLQIFGNTDQAKVWNDTYKQIAGAKFKREDGKLLSPSLVFIDSGFNTERVYNFCSLNTKFIATKGASETSKKIDFINKPKYIKKGVKLINIGTFKGKIELFRLLHIKEKGEGYFHYNENFTNEFFLQLTAEKLQKTKTKSGYDKLTYIKTRDRNEALDITLLAYAAAKVLKGVVKRKKVKSEANPR